MIQQHLSLLWRSASYTSDGDYIWSPFSSVPVISPFVHQCIINCVESISSRFYCTRDIVFSKEGTPYQHSEDEGSSAGYGCLPTQDHGRDLNCDEPQGHNGVVSQESRRDNISGHLQIGPGDHHLVRVVHANIMARYIRLKKNCQAIRIRSFPQSVLFFPGCSMTSAGSLVILTWICLPPRQT